VADAPIFAGRIPPALLGCEPSSLGGEIVPLRDARRSFRHGSVVHHGALVVTAIRSNRQRLTRVASPAVAKAP